MLDTLRFWLDRGVDGFRMDVIHLIGKGDDLPEPHRRRGEGAVGDHRRARAPTTTSARSGRCSTRTPATAPRWARCSSSTRPRWPSTTATTTSCTCRSTSPRCSAAGGRPAGRATSAPPRTCSTTPGTGPPGCCRTTTTPGTAPATAATSASPAPPPCCCSRCAAPRSSTPARSSASRTPSCPPERHVDPSGGRRDGCRAPIPWTPEAGPRLGERATPGCRSRRSPTSATSTSLRDDPGSILHLYRDLLAARRGSPALQLGSIEVLDSPDDVLVYERRHGDDARVVAISFAGEPVDAAARGHRRAVVGSRPRRRAPRWWRRCSPYEAVLLDPTDHLGAGHGQRDPHRGRRRGAAPRAVPARRVQHDHRRAARRARRRPRRRRRRQRRAGRARASRGQGVLRRVRARLVDGGAGRARTAPAGGCGTASPTSA